MKKFLLITLAFLIYSLSSVFLKLTSQQEFLDVGYVCYFGGALISMVIYAVLWQKVLTYMPLNKAFLCKSSTILIILAISSLIFDEAININNIIGVGFIMTGLGMLAWKD